MISSTRICAYTLVLVMLAAVSTSGAPSKAREVTVTVLSSNLADGGTIGEWGFSALVEVDGRCVLFDAGRHPDTVLRNAAALGVDLSCAADVVLSHFHFDHTTGLIPLLEDLRAKSPDAIRRVHVAKGFFLPRRVPSQSGEVGSAELAEMPEWNPMIASRKRLEDAGVEIIEYEAATEILPAVWVSGPVERRHAEKTFPTHIRVNIDGKWMEDYVPDSQGLTVVTESGPIVLLGCGHSGSVNLLEQVQRTIQNQPIQALMGGMHLYNADDATLGWTADQLRRIGLKHLMAGHCTGIEPLLRLRTGLNLTRETAVVGAVGSRFVYGEGIYPTAIAR